MENLLADRVQRMENKELADLMRLIGRDDIISFAGGIPCKDIFPVEKLKNITVELLNNKGDNIFQYSSTEGNSLLKKHIARYLTEKGLNPDTSELIITSGSQQALDLIAKIFINPGDKVAVEKPGYLGGIGALKSYEADLISIPMEADGINVHQLETRLEELKNKDECIKYIYLVPDYSNPSGARLSRPKRKKLIELAGKYNFYIIEDTPYSELNYYDGGREYMKKYDPAERIILMGSFSKFYVPGLRVGWVYARKELINLLGSAKQNADLASNSIGQHILARAFKEGSMEKQIQKILPYYRRRLEAMAGALDKYFPSTTDWNTPQGGFFFWVKLPGCINSRDLLEKAVANNVAFVTGRPFYDNPEDGNNYMRLSFSSTPVSEIKEGIRRLGTTIKNWQ